MGNPYMPHLCSAVYILRMQGHDLVRNDLLFITELMTMWTRPRHLQRHQLHIVVSVVLPRFCKAPITARGLNAEAIL
jgi:hypothetical protein